MNTYQDMTLRTKRRAEPMLLTAVAPLIVLASIATAVEARDRPGTPTDVTARSSGATMVSLSWRNTARKDEHVKFEVEPTKNGAPMRINQPDGTSGTGAGWLGSHGYVIRDLEPEARYCFRVWSRLIDNDVRSEVPSAWACADTSAHPPLAPLDLQATLPAGLKHVFLKWNTPDQSNYRRITSYEIERQSPPGPNRPTLSEGSIAGPDGEQTINTKLAYSFKSSAVDPTAKHEFRVCAVNSGGRTCAKPVAPVVEEPPLSATHVPRPDKKVITDPFKDTSASADSAIKGAACKPGFVWRVARPQDLVCVTPAARSRAARENAEAASHVNPAGAHGPNTCVAGFVWRAAFTGDVVCVTPEARTLARQENAEASRRTTAGLTTLAIPTPSAAPTAASRTISPASSLQR